MRIQSGIKKQTDKFVRMYENLIQKESPVQIKIVTHYDRDDIDCSGDYASIDIYLNGTKIKSYGDYYHDKGSEKVDGFLDGLTMLMTDIVFTTENIADY